MEDSVIEYVENIDDVVRFQNWLGQRREWLAYDTETGGLDEFRCGLRLAQVGDAQTAWVFRWDRWAGAVIEALTRYGARNRIVGHNLAFDVRFTEHHAGEKVFDWGHCHDTMVMSHILNPDKSKALKSAGARLLSPEAKRAQRALDKAMATQKWGWDQIPFDFPLYWGYAGFDTILTARLAEEFWPQIDSEFSEVYSLEMQTVRICSEMQTRGTRIDVSYCERKYDELENYCANLEKFCSTVYGVLPSENQKVAKVLLENGIDLTKLTPSGQWAMDKEVLESIDHPLAQASHNHRKATKIKSTYFKNLLEMHVDGFVHPSINTLGARTGRMSVQNPAVQTLPRGRVVRDAFVPREDQVILSSDYDAVEMRMLAHFCQDRGMIEAILEGDRTGSDIHTEMARIAYGDPSITKKDERRQTMKNGNFAKAYVAGAEKFAQTIGVTVDEAKAFFQMYDARFPGVKAFQKRIEQVAKHRLAEEQRAYVRCPSGRLQIADSADKLYTLVNYLIQGTCSDVLKQALVDLDNAGLGNYLMMPVHDEVLLDVPEGESEEIKKLVSETMTQTQWTVPLTATCEGPFASWGEKYA